MGSVSNQKKIQHLFSRAAFGITPQELEKRKKQSPAEAVEELFKESEHFEELQAVSLEQMEAMSPQDRKDLNEEERKKFRELRRKSVQDLNLTWLEKLWKDPARLRERMTFFWHGHFACRLEAPFALQELNNIHRRAALGSFREMLMDVSKCTAMLQFLNNQQNKKMHPNENFAREVMELFTLGRGNYTEQDIKEGARAFTGWSFEMPSGKFVFKANQHDDADKTFLGKTGNFKGEDILEILLEHKETALYITRKLYKFFVNDIEDSGQIRELADVFYASGYRIDTVMKHMFSSDWFYSPENIGAKIKSPVDLIVGLNRLIPITYDNKDGLLLFQRSLGQALFYPPNVSGWAGGKSWIDSSSLMFRLKTPALFVNEGHIDIVPKDDLLDGKPQIMNDSQKKEELTGKKKKFNPRADWKGFLASFPAGVSREEIIEMILVAKPSSALSKTLVGFKQDNHREFIMELLSTPEYQMA